MNYHRLKTKIDHAGEMKALHCSEHCHCRNKTRRTSASASVEDMRVDLRHGNKIALDIEFAREILKDLEQLVP